MLKDKKNFFYFAIMIFPIIDVLTSINARFNTLHFSPGIIVRGIIFLVSILYMLFSKTISKETRKKVIIYFIIFILYFATFMLMRLNSSIDKSHLISEITFFFKFWYFPITLIFLNNFGLDREKLNKALKVSTALYALGLFLPLVTNTYFESYSYSPYKGVVGWFYSANELGSLLSMSLVLLYLNLNKKNVLIMLINILTLVIIGTKVSLFSIIIICASMFIVFKMKDKDKSDKKKKSEKVKYSLIILIVSIVLILSSSTARDVLERLNLNKNSVIETELTGFGAVLDKLLSGRYTFFTDTLKQYHDENIAVKAIGLGFTYDNHLTSIEMDIFDIALRYGIIGFIIYFAPLIYYLYMSVKKYIKTKPTPYLICFIGVTLSMLIAILCGHMVSAPTASIFVSICVALMNPNSLDKLKEG